MTKRSLLKHKDLIEREIASFKSGHKWDYDVLEQVDMTTTCRVLAFKYCDV